jgi:hypothetical protein
MILGGAALFIFGVAAVSNKDITKVVGAVAAASGAAVTVHKMMSNATPKELPEAGDDNNK